MIDQKQLGNVVYFNYLGSIITNDARCTREIKSRTALAKAAFNKKKKLLNSKLDLNLRTKLVKYCIWGTALCGAETWTLRKADQKYVGSFQMWYWSKVEISWTDRVRNQVLHRVKEERNIVHTIKRRKASWIGHILRRICLLKHVFEGKLEVMIEATARRGRRRMQLLDDLKEKRIYWKLKEEALDRTVWRTRFGRGYVNVAREDTKLMTFHVPKIKVS
jgi:hypothetical protein